MRSPACRPFVLVLAVSGLVMAGCSSSEEEAVTPVDDSGGAETQGLDVGGADATPDATLDDTASADTGTADTGSIDARMNDARMEVATDSNVADSNLGDTFVADSNVTDLGTDSSVADVADSATTDVGSDTRDAATDTMTADAADAADARDASDVAIDTADTAPQFGTPPTCNGVIAAGEYGVHTDGQNQQTSDSNTWYMTWDDTNLYLAVSGPAAAEAVVLYVEKAPRTPSNGGTNADGSLAGFAYDSAAYATLPFRADLVVYGKATYREYRLADGSNAWAMSNPFSCYANVGNVRELSIPWSVIGGRPASMSFIAYAVSNTGFVYAPVPTTLGKGQIGTNATASVYFHVASTAPGSSSKPFADARTP